MSLQMMQPDGRNAKSETKARRHACPDQQGTSQSRPLGIRNPIDIAQATASLPEELTDQRQQPADVIAGSQFRDHPAVLRVHGDLRKERMAKQARPGVEQGNAGFIAGGLDPEN